NILAIRDSLRAGGHRCSIIATSRSTQTSDEPDVYHPRSVTALLGLLRKIDFDILHLHIGGNLSSRVLALALACSAAARNKSVLTVHSGAFAAEKQSAEVSRSGSVTGRVFRSFA